MHALFGLRSLVSCGLYMLLSHDNTWPERWSTGGKELAELVIDAVLLTLASLGAAAPIVVCGVGALVQVVTGNLPSLIVAMRSKERPFGPTVRWPYCAGGTCAAWRLALECAQFIASRSRQTDSAQIAEEGGRHPRKSPSTHGQRRST